MTTNRNELVRIAQEYGIRAHGEASHLYGEHPYAYHLEMVHNEVLSHVDLLSEEVGTAALAAAWVHDAIEDARQTYNDVKSVLGEPVAEIAYALTTLKGRNRAERAGEAYYNGIVAAGDAAILVKLCDRIANVTEAKTTGSRMLAVYRSEMDHFIKSLLPTQELQEKFLPVSSRLIGLVK